MKISVLLIGIMVLFGCQNFVDDQSGINGKIEDFVKDRLYVKDTIESVDFSRFLRGTDKTPVYYWLDYTFIVKSNGQKRLMKYHFETDSLLKITIYKDISPELKKKIKLKNYLKSYGLPFTYIYVTLYCYGRVQFTGDH